MMEAVATYEFPVPSGPTASPGALVRQAYAIARGFFDDDNFHLSLSVRGRQGSWEAWATAERTVSVDGTHQ
jgi:hypothetical protein